MPGGSREVYGEVRSSVVEQNTYDAALGAIRKVDWPANYQQYIDYTDRTDGQLTYMGFAGKGMTISASGWLLQKFTYDASGKMTQRNISYDAWQDRVATTYS